MPVFEYSCSDCRTQFELLILSSRSPEVHCPACASGRVKKLFSAFAVTGSLRRSGCAGCSSPRGCASCSSGGGSG